ncbi:hypothetical protein DCO44_13110 [Acinetobacter sp. AM]|nr:hypothetical protein DCO44_13110 [Acinetobacter sp. AM]
MYNLREKSHLLSRGYRSMLKTSMLAFSLLCVFSSTVNAQIEQPKVHVALHFSVAQEVAPCTNGFDEVNVCQLTS